MCEVQSIKYLGDCPNLPMDTPVGYPHIIDLDSLDHDGYEGQGISIADAVVTILFKFMPGALAAFLDLDRPDFHYIQAGRSSSRLDFCIKRKGRMVTVGFLNEKELGGWDDQHNYRIDGKATEEWIPVRFLVSDIYEQTDAEEMLEEASGHAYAMLMHKPWADAFPDQPIELVCGLSHGRDF